ncbi:MAG TPA: hypothetical protein VMR70_19520 [Flavisolibacter sp.]|nr:hypothetical protein [Flavisolibacter sp.]
MSLNNISLPSSLIADLYQNALVQDTARAVPVKKNLSFLGKNGKNILIVVNKSEVAYLPDNELNFLSNVLLACQLSLADVAIVNWQNSGNQQPQHIIEQLNSAQIILFDVQPALFGLSNDIPHFSVTKADNPQVVTAPSLSEIEKNKEYKKQLWMSLKTLFGI